MDVLTVLVIFINLTDFDYSFNLKTLLFIFIFIRKNYHIDLKTVFVFAIDGDII